MTATFIVTIHLPGLSAPDKAGLVTILTPSGIVEHRPLTEEAVASVHDVHEWSESLIRRMYPGKRNKLHGSQVMWEGPFVSSGLVTVLRVDCDD